ncbi:phosphodiester glycosidase family protein [Nocardioides caeni]|uniref:Phosphodiester glycosidase family protein n=1 Tax=Nocardioides caeni TaxID=574700 RepID=A0A4S8N2B8_9ACTN|nr:phosphodiester glycosidase family protein [Nocardioides caeni]THV09915.1 phosphodiester glycosidase family protein [Nocardioides caeni]
MRRTSRAASALIVSMLVVGGSVGPTRLPAGADQHHTSRGSDRGASQTSDGLPGEPVPFAGLLRSGVPVVEDEVGWSIRPGLSFRRWRQSDARGPNRVQVITADLDVDRLRVRYLKAGDVRDRKGVVGLVRSNRAVVGVNGDFFDIGGLGAPLGLGVDLGRVRHGTIGRPNAGFQIGRDRRPVFGPVALEARVRSRTPLAITRLNSPTVPRGEIGLYTSAWGPLAGRAVLGLPSGTHVREVQVRGGRVTRVSRTLTAGRRLSGHVLVGQGHAANALARLRVGQRVTISVRAPARPRMAITSNAFLLRDGVVRAGDDRWMHPRTAVGHDRDENLLFLVVVDGRSASSRGMTMVELATLMRSLGADDALNLDGGGSSTMVAPRADGVLGVLNRPSDGRQRAVPNGIGIDLRPAR